MYPTFNSRRSGASSSKTPLGSMCPICDHPLHKQHSRDHVAWHFMEELKAYIIDPSKCPECSYTGDKLESVARHLALYHQKLDQFLADTDLVAEKRAKAMAKPKKVSLKYICTFFHEMPSALRWLIDRLWVYMSLFKQHSLTVMSLLVLRSGSLQ